MALVCRGWRDLLLAPQLLRVLEVRVRSRSIGDLAARVRSLRQGLLRAAAPHLERLHICFPYDRALEDDEKTAADRAFDEVHRALADLAARGSPLYDFFLESVIDDFWPNVPAEGMAEGPPGWRQAWGWPLRRQLRRLHVHCEAGAGLTLEAPLGPFRCLEDLVSGQARWACCKSGRQAGAARPSSCSAPALKE